MYNIFTERCGFLVSIKTFTKFSTTDERDSFLKRYGLLSQRPRKEKVFYYKGRAVSAPVRCEIIGYDRIYSDSATLVIDYGEGPCFILSDHLKEMQDKNFTNS